MLQRLLNFILASNIIADECDYTPFFFRRRDLCHLLKVIEQEQPPGPPIPSWMFTHPH